MLEDVRALLQDRLEAAGFRPDPQTLKLVAFRISDTGQTELRSLFLLLRPPRTERAFCAYHLGTGAALTRFLVAGLGLSRTKTAEIATLGAIAQLIFALFDRTLDTGGHALALMPTPSAKAGGEDAAPEQRLLNRLLTLYYARLDALAPPAAHPVRALLEQAIRRLYEAELRSAPPPDAANPNPTSLLPKCLKRAWWRKNTLPVIVMGLPAWILVSGGRNIKFIEHLQWLARVGEFFGWLDDFCDYEEDSRSGHINRLRLEDAVPITALACRAGDRGRRVLSLWDARNTDSPSRDTFRVLSWTWLTKPEL